MEQMRFENQGTSTYLVYELGADEALDTMSLGMLTNNKITGVAQTVFMQMDNHKFIKYNVSAKVSLQQFLTGVVAKNRFLGALRGIVAGLLTAEEYMLDLDTILLEPERIFVNVTNCEIALICVPVLQKQKAERDLREFFRGIMFSTQFDQTENCGYIAELLNYLNSPHAFSLVSFKEALDKIEPDKEAVKPLYEKEENEKGKKSKVTPAQGEQLPPVSKPKTSPAPKTREKSVAPIPKSVPTPVNTPKVPPVVPPGKQPTAKEKPEAEMSLFYLLQHYNKENAQAYKAQKERKKAKKGMAQEGTAKQKKPKKAPKSVAVPTPQATYAVPGQALSPETPPVAVAAPVTIKESIPVIPSAPQPQVVRPTQPSQPINISAQGGTADFGETSYFGVEAEEESDTVIMGETGPAYQMTPHLLRRSNGEKIPINKEIFRLGRDVAFNDYVVLDNKFVGHSHCYILTRGGEYFVVDTKSKNHTTVNGVVIEPEQEVKIVHGDVIELANEAFEFRLY